MAAQCSGFQMSCKTSTDEEGRPIVAMILEFRPKRRDTGVPRDAHAPAEAAIARSGPTASCSERSEGAGGEIILFTGVRYSRGIETEHAEAAIVAAAAD